MATYYVDPTALINGTGGFGDPFNRWQGAGIPWAPNNIYLQKAGTTHDGEVVPAASGTSETTRIIIGSYDPITGARTRQKARMINTAGGRAMGIAARTYITVEDIEFVGGKVGANRRCLSASGANFLKLSRLWCHDVTSDGATDCNAIFIEGANMVVEDCLIHDIADDAIWIEGANPRVVRNTVYKIALSGRVAGDCIQIYGGAVAQRNDAFYIAHNTLDHSTRAVKQAIIVSGSTLGTGGVIEYNTIIGPDSKESGYVAILCDQPGAIIQGNNIKNGFTGISIQAAITVTSNYINGCGTGIELTTTAAANCVVQQNTITNTINYAVYNAVTATGAVIRNNFYYKCGKGSIVTSSVSRTNNHLFMVYSALSDCSGGGCATETYGTTDPTVLDNGIPKTPTSVLLTSGDNLGWIRDLEGRLGKSYIGAYSSTGDAAERGVR